MNIQMSVLKKEDSIDATPEETQAFIAVGWFDREELKQIHRRCPNGVFIDTSPDEKLFDAVRPNLDSFVTQMVDFFVEKGHKTIGFIDCPDRNVDAGKSVIDIREWSFRQSAEYYDCLNEAGIAVPDQVSVFSINDVNVA